MAGRLTSRSGLSALTPGAASVNAGEMAGRTRPVEIAPRVWWVSAMLAGDRFQCHTYLVEQGDQSVLVDPGSALTADAVRRNVEGLVGLQNVRWVVCSHADPDIIAAVPVLLDAGLDPRAAVLTHWRDEALLRHLGWPLPFRRIEDLGWRLELEDRTLRFVFTPYVHFAGAFCTFDERTGTLFSSDLFGGFTDDDVLIADPGDSLDGMRSFHEHYMPSREALAHSIDQLDRLPIQRIAPQHGKILTGGLVARVLEEVATWECGLYLETGEDPGLAFLFTAHRILHDLAQVMLEDPDFAHVANHVERIAAEHLDAIAIELWACDGADVLVFDGSDGFRGRREQPPEDVGAVLDGRSAIDSTRLLLPLTAVGSTTIEGVAAIELRRPRQLDGRERRLLGEVAGLVATAVQRELARRLAELDRAALYEQAVRDGLTGLHNRFYLRDVLPQILAGADRDGGAVSVLMIDVDHFKRVNDRYGHLTGDAVLRHLGTVLAEECRLGDLAVRFGGEEFLVVLPGADKLSAEVSAARLRMAIAQTPEALPHISASVGIAHRRPMEGVDALLERADHALYEAKEAGRDRLVVAR